MTRRNRARLLAALGTASLLAFSASMGFAKEGADAAEIVPTYSFSGAFLAGRAAEADDDLDSAIAYYKRALTFEKDNQALQQSLLLALISGGRFDDAIPYAQKLKAVPEVERFSRLALAVDAFRNEQYSKAEDWLELVLESDLDRLITGVMTGWAKVGQGDFEGALAHLDAIDGPQWYTVFLGYHRALVALQGGLEDRASEEFDTLLTSPSVGSAGPDTFMRAAEAYAAFLAGKGDKEKALATLDNAEAFISGRAATTMLREKIESGADVQAAIANAGDGAAEILLNVSTALNRGGGEAFVRLYLNYASALRPENDGILMQLAIVAEQQNESEKAIAYYARIPDASPWRRMAELQTGLNLADLDRYDEAIGHLETALEQDPDDMRAYLAVGRVHAARKEFQAAAEIYDKAAARIEKPKREHWAIFYQRGIAYERLKEWPKAEPNFHKALELYPDQPQVLNYLGYSWVDMGMNLEEGLELIRRAVELRPNDGYIVDSLGWAYYKLGRYEDAVRELERAVSLTPGDAVLNDHLGDAYWRVGRQLEATYQWAHARDLDPEPDIAASVEKKLAEGLPELEPKKLAEASQSGDVVSDAPAESAEAGSGDDAKPGETVAPEMQPAAEPEVDAQTPDDAAGSYTIKAGETLWSIAVDQLGDGERFREILKMNPALQRNPDLLRPGQEIQLPQATQ